VRGSRRWLRSAIAAAILGVVVWRLGTGPFLDGLRTVDSAALSAAAALAVLTTLCCAWRWRLVAGGLGVDLRAPYGAALALDGVADAWTEGNVSPWDIAPFVVLFEEAGARFTDLAGARAWPCRSGLAAPPALHAALLDVLVDTRSAPP